MFAIASTKVFQFSSECLECSSRLACCSRCLLPAILHDCMISTKLTNWKDVKLTASRVSAFSIYPYPWLWFPQGSKWSTKGFSLLLAHLPCRLKLLVQKIYFPDNKERYLNRNKLAPKALWGDNNFLSNKYEKDPNNVTRNMALQDLTGRGLKACSQLL